MTVPPSREAASDSTTAAGALTADDATTPTTIARYGVALLVAAIAFAGTMALGPLIGRTPFLLFYAAVAIAAWYGGLGPGLLTAAIGMALIGFYVLVPRGDFALSTAADVIAILGFAVVAWLGSALTERLRRAHGEADRATRRFAVILEGAADGITAQDPGGRLVFANEAAARATGYESPAAMLAAPPGEFLERFELLDRHGGPFPLDRLPGRLAALGEEGADTLIQYRNRATGELRWSMVRARAVRDRDGRVSLVINIFRDTTELMEQQQLLEQQSIELEQQLEESQTLTEELEQSNEQLADLMAEAESARAQEEAARLVAERAAERIARLQGLTAALSGAISVEAVTSSILDQGLGALDASAGMVALLEEDGRTITVVREVGYSPGALDAYRHAGIETRTPLADAIRTGKPVHISSIEEYRARYPETGESLSMATGTQALVALPLEVHGRIIGGMKLAFRHARRFEVDESGFVLALAQHCAQAIERAQLFDREREARTEAEAANRAKSEFLAAMSHELRTPLNAIAGYAELLEVGIYGALAAEQREALQRIRRSQHHLLALVNNVLNFARVEAGRIEIRADDVVVRSLVEGLEALIAPQVREKRLIYSCEPCDPAIIARADAEKAEQILLNLLSNAVKFTPAGGRIAVAATARDAEVRIAVRDSGVGISAEKLEAIFEPFVQLDRSLTRPRDGTGLGLAISRDLARRMGGDLEVQSTPGGGSVFTLRLPRSSAAPSEHISLRTGSPSAIQE